VLHIRNSLPDEVIVQRVDERLSGTWRHHPRVLLWFQTRRLSSRRVQTRQAIHPLTSYIYIRPLPMQPWVTVYRATTTWL